jgi:hypothetical protein
MVRLISVEQSSDPKKKLDVKIETDKGRMRTIRIGQKGASDFTQHRMQGRKNLYLSRHQAREDWTKDGVLTAGFWARWLLWNKETLQESIRDVKSRFSL